MAGQRRDHEVDRPISPYGDHAVGVVAPTCKISNSIPPPLTTSLRRGMGHRHGAAQYPLCLPDNCRLNLPAVAFRLWVEHHQIFHARLSPHRYLHTAVPVPSRVIVGQSGAILNEEPAERTASRQKATDKRLGHIGT